MISLECHRATISGVNQRFGRSVIGGSLIGLVTGIGALLLMAPIMINNVDARPVFAGSARVDSFFSIGAASVELPHLVDVGGVTLFTGTLDITPLGLLSVFAATGYGIAGLLTAAAIMWLPLAFDPDAVPPKKAGRILGAGLVTGAITGLLFAQGAVVWLGERSTTTAEFPILAGILWGLVAGIGIGSTVAAITHLLSRPDVIGLEELGWETPEQFREATGRAVGVPMVALVIIAVIVGVFGALFLGIAPEVGEHGAEEAAGGSKVPLLVIASLIASSILGLAALVAYRPGSAKRRGSR